MHSFNKYIPLVIKQTVFRMSTTSELNVTFNREQYFTKLGESVKKILQRPTKDVLAYDILDTDKLKVNNLVALKVKQRQMKIGDIWQIAIGNYKDCIYLKKGHVTGLDVLSHSRRLAIEVKNRTNTTNSDSKASVFNKLAKFKAENPDYTCIYANINDNTEEKSSQATVKKFQHNGVELEHHIGDQFLKYIFGDDTNAVVEFLKTTIDKYS
jgi:hypothetical protein